MATSFPSAFTQPVEQPLPPRRLWGWLLALGIAMVAVGTFILGWSCLTTVTFAVTWAFGFVLLASGIVEIVSAFSAGNFRGIAVHILLGVLYAVAGFTMVSSPAESALILTKVLAIILVIAGLFRILAAVVHRFPHWGLVALSGLISLVLGIMIWRNWPATGLWFIGLAFGIDLIFNGWTWILLALGLKRLPPAEPTPV